VFLLALRHVKDDTLDLVAVISFIAVVAGTVLFTVVIRSERMAGAVGRHLGKFVGAVAGMFRREVTTNFGSLVTEFREQAATVLRTRTLLGLVAGLTARVASFLVRLLAVRFVGITAETVHWTVLFGAFSLVMAATVIPLFNMPGVTEIVLIGVLNAAAPEATEQVAATVFVYRILTWLAPIPFGGVAFNRWRRQVRESDNRDLLDSFEAAPHA
jgi:site-specific recombinase